MTKTIKIKAKDILDENNQLKAIEFHDMDGEFQFQAMWDSNDPHTPEKIAEFRVWCAKMATRLDYELDENN